ncbi:TetR/AcrR family transcriptional regulator [Lachnotalea sp. AF33-28]|jgi:AcrR family transcriptional regulator|uniref:TetR/AcrR family transcriptional regulator n=1 Tax=Lachnotalea sp. AF33-28 TaxID=2292046 RepID=UPI000E52C540|nr:TetR/AcrR family transcriptional regulator [Lachnotalea sp. AF33-28]RHP30961.1 TetR/AcrR family transcriptional regulator [Lachnotalea sp. AF33-28]
MTTKERIIDQALDLFSRKGYDGVSVRDISGAVGIKESSLYNHFKNKQDIFDTIVEEGFLRAGNYFRQQSLPFSRGDDLSVYRETDVSRLTELILRTFSYFFEDPFNTRFRRLLTVSQFGNERAKEVYIRLYRDYPVQFQSHLFAALMETGEFRRGDPEAAARDFYGVMFMLIHTCDSFEEAKPAIREHVKQFASAHLIRTEGEQDESDHNL